MRFSNLENHIFLKPTIYTLQTNILLPVAIGVIQSCKKLVSWVSWIPRNIFHIIQIEEHSVKITDNFVAFIKSP